MKKGFFIVIEGSDGAGKDTAIKAIEEFLKDEDVVYTREPGADSQIGHQIRSILLNKENKDKTSYLAEMFMYQADRAQNVHEIIKPALNAGKFVVSNRYYHSTIIYQSLKGVPMRHILDTTEMAVDGCYPDLVISLYTDSADTIDERLSKKDRDRWESEPKTFFEKVNNEYQNLRCFFQYKYGLNITSSGKQIYPVEHVSTSQSMEEVAEQIKGILKHYIDFYRIMHLEKVER